jgi:uncharacterized membrane protein YfcA
MHELLSALSIEICCAFVLAGFVKGVTGMGLPTVIMGSLGALIGPLEAASLLVLPSLVTNVWQSLAGPGLLVALKRFWSMMLGICAGTVGAASVLSGNRSHWPAHALGAVLMIYAALGLLNIRFLVRPRVETLMSPVIGLATGVVTGLTGVFVVPAVPYLQSLGLERDALVGALGLSFTVSTIALAAGLALNGSFCAGNLLASAWTIVPALLGMFLGQAVRSRINPELFRNGFFIVLLMLGADLLLRG